MEMIENCCMYCGNAPPIMVPVHTVDWHVEMVGFHADQEEYHYLWGDPDQCSVHSDLAALYESVCPSKPVMVQSD